MGKGFVANALLAGLFVIVSGCAALESARHDYLMGGEILEVDDGAVYLCIGRENGAKIGQEFTVYRFKKVAYARPRYVREEVGKIKIVELVEEHYATAKILAGEPRQHDFAALH